MSPFFREPHGTSGALLLREAALGGPGAEGASPTQEECVREGAKRRGAGVRREAPSHWVCVVSVTLNYRCRLSMGPAGPRDTLNKSLGCGIVTCHM